MKQSVGKAILALNDEQSLRNRKRLDELGLVAVNVLASPGAGKTSLILRLLEGLSQANRTYALGVIEGDVAGSLDTDKIRALGFAAVQINTDGGCHLEAKSVASAIEALGIRGPGYLFIENIGNLICPSQFHLGESVRLVVASVSEGDDKPAKYPGVFATGDVIILNKMDLIGHTDFRMEFFRSRLAVVNSAAPLCCVSCRSGQGISQVLEWLTTHAAPAAFEDT